VGMESSRQTVRACALVPPPPLGQSNLGVIHRLLFTRADHHANDVVIHTHSLPLSASAVTHSPGQVTQQMDVHALRNAAVNESIRHRAQTSSASTDVIYPYNCPHCTSRSCATVGFAYRAPSVLT
jgi:hypothetical protein